MAKSKILGDFVANTPQYLANRGGVSNLVLSNVTTVDITAAVGVSEPRLTAYYVKNLVIPPGTAIDVLDGTVVSTEANKLFVETNTTGGMNVVYTAI